MVYDLVVVLGAVPAFLVDPKDQAQSQASSIESSVSCRRTCRIVGSRASLD
jgi:hypothetical protein